MPLDQLANVVEILAALLVIVSLIYVGAQVRQNTHQHRAEWMRAAINELLLGIAQATADEESANNFRDGLHDFNSMMPNARARFHARMLSLTGRYGLVVQLHDTRLLGDADFLALQKTFISIFRSPGAQQWWAHIQPMPPEPLRNHLDQAVKDSRIDIQQLDQQWPWMKKEN